MCWTLSSLAVQVFEKFIQQTLELGGYSPGPMAECSGPLTTCSLCTGTGSSLHVLQKLLTRSGCRGKVNEVFGSESDKSVQIG